MDFNKRLAETMIKAVNNPDYINTEIFKWKHEKEMSQKLSDDKIQFLNNLIKNIEEILKQNPRKISSYPHIREADLLDINGRPYGDWCNFRRQRREAGIFFPLAHYDFRDPSGFLILRDDCSDLLDLLQSGRFNSINLISGILTNRCDFIMARFIYLNAYTGITPNSAPDYLKAGFSTFLASKRGKSGGEKPKMENAIYKALEQFIKEDPDLIQASNNSLARKFAKWLLSDNRYIEHATREWYIFYVEDSKLIFAEPDKTTKKSKITSLKLGTIRTEYIPKIKNTEK